jgi:glutamate racemase
MDKRPIGVFDSGLGGLSAVKAMLKVLPQEDIIYFGDTGRVPYGTRSEKTIELYAKEDIAFLQQFDCKLIMAACGTVSSVAKGAIAQVKEPFVEVVTPASVAAVKATKNNKIGVMGTSATINSGSYVKTIHKINPDIQVDGVSCPLLVSLVENDWIDSDDSIARLIVQRYLEPLMEQGVDTIILGCTHFPHLAPIISKVAGE